MANWWEQDKIAVAEPNTLAVTPKVTRKAWYQNDEIVGSPLPDKKSPQFKEFALTKEGSGMVIAEAPEIAAKIAAKEAPSRNDFKELGISGWNAEERKQLSSLFRDALVIPPTGISEIADPKDVPLLPYTPGERVEPTRPRWQEARDAAARGLASMGSAGKQLIASFWGTPSTYLGLPIPKKSAQAIAEKKRADKARDDASFLWEVSKNPALAAQNKDLASKALNLMGETLPYITATTAGFIVGGPLGAFAVGSLVEGNSAYRTALDAKVSEKKAQMIGTGVGVISGAVEAFGGRYAEQLLLKAVAKLKSKIAKAGAVFGIGTVVEALEEGAQEVAQITGEETYRDVDWKERAIRVLSSMAGGAFLGGVMRGGSVAARGVITAAEKVAPPKPTEPSPTEAVVEPEKPVAGRKAAKAVEEPLTFEEHLEQGAIATTELQISERAKGIFLTRGVQTKEGARFHPEVMKLNTEETELYDKGSKLREEGNNKEGYKLQQQAKAMTVARYKASIGVAEKPVAGRKAEIAPVAKAEAKQPWEMTGQEYAKSKDYKARRAKMKRIKESAGSIHFTQVRKALEAGKPVPAEVLAEYPDLAPVTQPEVVGELEGIKKANPELTRVAQKSKTVEEFINKMAKGKPETVSTEVLTEFYNRIKRLEKAIAPVTQPKAVEVEKEIKYEKEAITEPAPSPEVEPREAGELIPTGKLDPTSQEDALEITQEHINWVAWDKDRTAWEGISSGEGESFEVSYTPEQIDTAYRTIQKPVESPMPDVELFAMPGKEAQVKAIAQKMAKVKGVVKPKKMGPKALTKPTALPKAKKKIEDFIKAVYAVTQKEATRYAINGIKVEGDTIIATDGRRMFWAKGKWGKKDGVYLDVASLKKGSLGKLSKTDAPFPRWRDIVPDVSDMKPIMVNLEAALSHVRQAAILTSEESKGITIIENKDEIMGLGFAAASPEIGHAEINVYEGGRILGAVNPIFLMDAIKFHAIRGDTVIEFYFKAPDRPILTKSPDGKTSTLTMPINIEKSAKDIAEAKAISEGKKAEPVKVEKVEPEVKPKSKGLKEKPAKPKKKSIAEAMQAIKEHYTPGNIVYVQYWRTHDRVIEFKETDTGFLVKVQKVEKQDGKWIAVGDVRTHMTAPSRGDKVVERAAPVEEKPVEPEEKAEPAAEPPDIDLQIQENAVAQIPESPKIGTTDRAVLDSLKKPITPEEKGILLGMGLTVEEILKGNPAELRKKIAVSKNARRRMGGFFNVPIETPDPVKVRTFFETLYQNVVNRFASIENITKKAKRLGMDIPPGMNPTMLARLYLGHGRKVESILRDKTFRIDIKGNIIITGEGLKPILDSYDLKMTKYERNRKQRQKDFNQYLFAQRTILDLQRPAYEGAPRLIVTPGQVAQAKKDLAVLEEKLGVKAIAEMERHAQRLYAFQKRILQSLVYSGNMSQKLYDKIVKENPHYIPFDRVLNKDTFAGGPVTKNRFTKARAGIRKIKGTELEIEKQNPIESVIKNTHRIIEAAERNLVARSIARLSKVLPGDLKPVRIKMYPIRVDPAEILTVVKEFRSKSAKITEEFRKTRTEGGETADVSGPIKKLESVVKEALTNRGFSEGEANSFVVQIRKGKPTTEGGKSTHTVETIRQVIKETQKIMTSEVPVESTIFRPSQFAPKGNLIEYYENGKRRYMEVSPNLHAAMTGLTEEGASIVARILSVPAHWLRVGATITPEFMARNPIRDTYTALMQTSFGFIPFFDSIGAIASIVGKTEVYNDWIRSGAAHSGFVELSRPALLKAYKGLQTTWGKRILSKLNIIADAQDISQILEEATRVAIFKRATRRGLSDVEAGFEAREATVDFARRGAKMGNINKTIAFFNARIQGFDKTIRHSIAHPYSTAIKGLILFTLPSLVLYLRNRDDEDYKELKQWKKDLFWNVKVCDIWFRYPKSFLYGQIFGSLPERFFEYLDTKDRSAFDGLATSLSESASPIGLNPIEALIPTGIKPFVENFFNYNLFRERTLVPEHLISGPKPDQYTRYTSETAKQLGEWFNMSPAKIENTIYGLTGGTGGHILGGTDVLINAIKGESSPRRPKGLADIPLIKGFVSRDPTGPSAQSIADFYIETKRITGLRTSWMGKRKKGDGKAAAKMLEKNPELVLGPTLVKFQTALSKLSKSIDSITQGDLSTEDKRARIKEFDQRRLDLARQANDLIKEKKRISQRKKESEK